MEMENGGPFEPQDWKANQRRERSSGKRNVSERALESKFIDGISVR